jgi:hypothetical protein
MLSNRIAVEGVEQGPVAHSWVARTPTVNRVCGVFPHTIETLKAGKKGGRMSVFSLHACWLSTRKRSPMLASCQPLAQSVSVSRRFAYPGS